MIHVRIPTPLRPSTAGSKDVTADGRTVGAALTNLADRYPALGPHLYNGDGALRSYIVVFHNDRDVRDLQGLETPLADGDRLMIVPSIAGGADPAVRIAGPGHNPAPEVPLLARLASIGVPVPDALSSAGRPAAGGHRTG